uniref:Transcription factor CBF/NF-Y/archaeal histone domain-containing protein n=1 Tax=Oryza meridionalis TaxID=40149 RepID=A0A0E0DTF6_9ORYZ
MRKKLDTRFPAPRIKKIMQADEDVGKIALAVPVLKLGSNGVGIVVWIGRAVSKVPDMGTSDAGVDDKLGKRRKTAEDDSEEESKRTRNVRGSKPDKHWKRAWEGSGKRPTWWACV